MFWAGSRISSSAAAGSPRIIAAQLVDLVEHQHRIVDAGPAHRLNDPARHRADVGAAMAAQLGLVVHAAQAEPLELAAQRPGDRLAERRLADAGRADEAQDRRLGRWDSA